LLVIGLETIMIRNGLYLLNASSRDGVAEYVGGVLILRDGQLHGGDAYVYYTGSYECSAGGVVVSVGAHRRAIAKFW
jgi:hypothetical protein